MKRLGDTKNVDYYIGAGGWGYFGFAGDRLAAYARRFRFVEVNATFYKVPQLSAVKRWRRQVKEDFVFTVKCNRTITHDAPFVLGAESRAVMQGMQQVCDALKAPFLVLQTPASLLPTDDTLERIASFFDAYSEVRFAWEPRGDAWAAASVQKQVRQIGAKHGVVFVSDASRSAATVANQTLYTRLFGGGSFYNRHQFDDSELQSLHRAVESSGADRAFLVFHTVRMYTDAQRFDQLRTDGVLPPVTARTDGAGALETIGTQAAFPITRARLQREYGWRLFQVSTGGQLRLSNLLEHTDKKMFETPAALRQEVDRLLTQHIDHIPRT
jgi:uncharacterized protein YecE (DUF72 family)